MPDVYINRNGVEMQEVDTRFQATDMEELKAKLAKQDYDMKVKFEIMQRNLEEYRTFPLIKIKHETAEEFKRIKKESGHEFDMTDADFNALLMDKHKEYKEKLKGKKQKV